MKSLLSAAVILFITLCYASGAEVSRSNFRDSSYGCVCQNYTCGCCAHIEAPRVGLNDTGCVNLTYLPNEYGISFTMTIDNLTIYNETISARNPPPMCFGAPILKEYADLCLHFYDLNVTRTKMHGCAQLEARLHHVVVGSYKLGCFNIENGENYHSRLFPDLPKLKAQNAYLDAMAKGDIARIQEIQMAYRLTDSTRSKMQSERSTVFTPATFETPDIKQMDSPSRTEETEVSQSAPTEKLEKSLDQFLNNTTSEDNASFQVVMERSEHAHKQKYPWLYKDEETESKKVTDMLSPPTAAIEFKKPELAMWTYKNKNALMYVPDGVELTAEERLALGRKEIKHKNTHFEGGAPFAGDAHKEAIAEAAALQAKMKEGKVGIDGKEILPEESPQVNGYGFVGTPLPQPGVNDTPLMTWGEIEGTPFRLDGGDTPLPQNLSGQQFKIPQPSARERIAHSLADKVAKKHRKNPSGKSPYQMRSPSCSPMTTQERLLSMSPAARRLACAKLGVQWGSDRALRASYSPSPVRKPSTPLLTPSPVPSSKPKRHKASDFF